MRTQAIVTDEGWLAAAADTATAWLSLAAAPAFAVMAMLAATGPHDVLCSVGAGPVNGMAWMYALMSVRHAGPWLKLLASVSTSRS